MRLLLALLLFVLSCAHAGELPEFQPRPGHERPVIAILGDSVSTEITDFLLPYGVLQRAGVAHVFAVAAEGPLITMYTGLRVQADLDISAFDQRYPEGADYVIVPAMRRAQLAPMLAWLQAQADKGATVASICDGALVVANSGLLKGRRGTARHNLSVWLTHYTDQWLHGVNDTGLPLAEGFDEIALAYTSDAYTRTHRSRVLAVGASDAAVASRHGLKILPDRVAGAADAPAVMLPAVDSSLDRVLANIADSFGSRTARRVALEFEYPGYPVR